MINIRKIVLFSALLLSASSITAPMHAMIDDKGDVVQAARVIHAQTPYELTQDMISEIRQHGSFLAAAKEYVLQNPEQLEAFASCLNPDPYYPFYRHQSSYMDYTGLLNYYIQESGGGSQRRNPDYDPTRPEETGPEWIDDGYSMELSRLIFKEQDPAPAKSLGLVPKVEEQESGSVATSSMQASSSADPSHEVDPETAIKVLIERYGDDRLALANALAELWKENLK